MTPTRFLSRLPASHFGTVIRRSLPSILKTTMRLSCYCSRSLAVQSLAGPQPTPERGSYLALVVKIPKADNDACATNSRHFLPSVSVTPLLQNRYSAAVYSHLFPQADILYWNDSKRDRQPLSADRCGLLYQPAFAFATTPSIPATTCPALDAGHLGVN